MTGPQRNDPCPCGSGRKYKKCCLGKAPAPSAAPVAAVDPAQLVRRALQEQRSGRLEAARRLFEQALALRPRDAMVLAGLGHVTGQLGRIEEGVEHLRRAIGLEPWRPEFHLCLSELLLTDGDPDGALACAEKALALERGSVQAHNIKVIALGKLNRLEAADEAARAALAIAPHDPELRLVHAGLRRRVARESGDRAAARAAAGEARLVLEELLSGGRLAPLQRHKAVSDLAFVLDTLGEHDEAFAAFEEAGRLQAAGSQARRLDPTQWSRRIEHYRRGLTPGLMNRFRGADFDDGLPAPAMLVGFPRSGTTMIEQVLAAHGDVVTSNEAELLMPVRKRLGEGAPDREDIPALLAALDLDGARALRALYWEAARRAVGEDLGHRVFVDKQPLHLVDVALAATLFPDARVLVALRDPRDVCLSCFMQRFNLNSAMINFLSWPRTAEFYEEVMGLWLHVRPMLPIAWEEIRYEDVVDDLEGNARRMCVLYGLAWDERVLEFHEQAKHRRIKTPSAAAVTQPVNRAAVGRWTKYEKHFASVMGHLAPFVEAFGYE